MELLKSIITSFGYAPIALALGIIFQILAIELGEPGSPNTILQILCFVSFGWVVFQIIRGIFFGK